VARSRLRVGSVQLPQRRLSRRFVHRRHACFARPRHQSARTATLDHSVRTVHERTRRHLVARAAPRPLAECGVLDGVEQADYEVAYAAAAEYISGIPLLDLPDSATFQQHVGQWLRVMANPVSTLTKGANSTVRSSTWRVEIYRTASRDCRPATGTPSIWVHTRTRRLRPSRCRPVAPQTHDKSSCTSTLMGLTDDELNAGGPHQSVECTTADNSHHRRCAGANPLGTGVPPHGQRVCERRTSGAAYCPSPGPFTDLVAWMEHGTVPAGEDVLTADPSTLGAQWTRQ
jgi:hypothetical protein